MHEVRVYDPRGKLKQVVSPQELWDRVFKKKHRWRSKAVVDKELRSHDKADYKAKRR